jgi:hypothetical protein
VLRLKFTVKSLHFHVAEPHSLECSMPSIKVRLACRTISSKTSSHSFNCFAPCIGHCFSFTLAKPHSDPCFRPSENKVTLGDRLSCGDTTLEVRDHFVRSKLEYQRSSEPRRSVDTNHASGCLVCVAHTK